jgi:hypothetical protein
VLREFQKNHPERAEAWSEIIEKKISDLLTSTKPSTIVMSASPVKGPADLEKDALMERARVAAEAQKSTTEDNKTLSKDVTPAKNALLHTDDMMDWSDVDKIFPPADFVKDPKGPGAAGRPGRSTAARPALTRVDPLV